MTARTATVLFLGLTIMVSMSWSSGSALAEDAEDITYSVGGNGIEIHSANTTTLISNSFPAATVRAGNLTNLTGDGFVLRALLGYNASFGNGFSPSMVEFRAPTNHTIWTVSGPQLKDTDQGKIVTLQLTATLDMVRVGGAGYGGPNGLGPGGPQSTVQSWAEVTVRFQVSARNYFAAYQGVPQSPEYPVNGSSELKFDVGVIVMKPLPVDSLALEIALMKMDDASYTPTSSAGHYTFRGYQAGGTVSGSDPSMNETEGSTLVTHTFQSRDQFKQMVDFVNDTGVPDGYFSWARQARISTPAGASLVNVSTHYRTDGESLTIYLSTPLSSDTITVDHDPSIGVLGGGGGAIVFLPGTPSLLWIGVGIIVGLASVGGTGAYLLTTRNESRDPADPVDLQRNRYYRGRP
ncbi:MAG: hypothetical protein ABIE25_01755 [Thermoplasmatota archaeon]